MYNLDFVGLACFSKADEPGRFVLLPDGREPDDGIDPHVPQLVVKTDAIESIDESLPREVIGDATVITLPQSVVHFEGADTSDRRRIDLDDSRHAPFLQRLSTIDRRFNADDHDRTVVRVRIRRGRLLAFQYPSSDEENSDPAIVSQLNVPHDGPITVTVVPKEQRKPAQVRLRPGTEIVLANTAPAQDEFNTVSHFRIYEKLSTIPVDFGNRPPVVASNLRSLRTENPFFAIPSGSGENGDCGNTGCCP